MEKHSTPEMPGGKAMQADTCEIRFVRSVSDEDGRDWRTERLEKYASPAEGLADEFLHLGAVFASLEETASSVIRGAGRFGDDAGGEGEISSRVFQNAFPFCEAGCLCPDPGNAAPGATVHAVIEIDPFHAFGDGRHPTTSLCMSYLMDHLGAFGMEERKGHRLLDAGAGTAVLSIVADKLGVGRIDAVELDETAAGSACRNVRLNRCGGVSVFQGDIRRFGEAGVYDVILANLIAGVLADCAGHLASLLKRGGVMIASGVIESLAAGVEESLHSAGLSITDSAWKEGWIAYRLEKR
jgi:ribosomal protein L11 methylase PrmA